MVHSYPGIGLCCTAETLDRNQNDNDNKNIDSDGRMESVEC